MARGVTLVKLLNDLRAECRLSLNPAHNAQDRAAQVIALQRAQELFWGDFAWPHLRVDRFIDIQNGQRYYDMPDDLDIDRITDIQVRYGSIYQPLKWGIGAPEFAVYDSELDVRATPPMAVKITEDEQLEVWPIPDQNADLTTLDGRIKVTGIRRLSPFVNNDDTADLDDRLLILYCAAEYLASIGAKDAQVRQDKANKHYLKLRGRLMPRRKFSMFDVTSSERPRRPAIGVYRPPV